MDANEAKATLKAGLEAAEADLKKAQDELREAERRVKKCETEVSRFRGAYRVLTGEMPPGGVAPQAPPPPTPPSGETPASRVPSPASLGPPITQIKRCNGEMFNIYRPVCVEITAFLSGKPKGGTFATAEVAPIIGRFYPSKNAHYLRDIARTYLQHFISKGLVVKTGRSKGVRFATTEKFHVTLGSSEEARRRIEEERKMMKDLMDR